MSAHVRTREGRKARLTWLQSGSVPKRNHLGDTLLTLVS